MAAREELSVTEKDWEYVLIDAYEDEECLWAVSRKDYRNKDKRQNALERIAAKVGKPVNVVKKKIENLRSYYNKELAKVKDSTRSGAGTDEVYTSKWSHFDNLDSFLRNQVVQRKTVSNLDEDDDGDDTCILEDILCKGNDTQSEDNNQPPNDQEKITKKRTAACFQRKPTSKRKADDNLIIEATKALKSVTALPNVTHSPVKAVLDEFDIFGQHVANEMRHINNFQARQFAKLKIQSVLFEAQFSQQQQHQQHPFMQNQAHQQMPTVQHPPQISGFPGQPMSMQGTGGKASSFSFRGPSCSTPFPRYGQPSASTEHHHTEPSPSPSASVSPLPNSPYMA